MICILLHTEKKAPRSESKGFGSKWGSIVGACVSYVAASYCNRL